MAAEETVKANLSCQLPHHHSNGCNYCWFETKELISDHSENPVVLLYEFT